MGHKGSETRQRIINVSMQLFSVKGYYNTSIVDILDATNLTKGGLYGHFRSKEDIWYAVYQEAVSIWRKIVFEDIRSVANPIERVEKVIERDLMLYLGGDTFDGGCFFLSSLVELSGQSGSMSRHILKGYVGFSRLIRRWMDEAVEKKQLTPDVNSKEIADFIVVSINGAAALYASTRDPVILKLTLSQLKHYIQQLSSLK